jgi:hypothetical protein
MAGDLLFEPAGVLPMKFSVVIPTYNRPHLLARAIRSVEEHLPGAEIVVVDDASIMPEPVGAGVRYFRQPRNQGPGAARNRGIAQATGDWLICLDDDDTIRAGAAETIARAILTTLDIEQYPVLQFRTGDAREIGPFRLFTLDDYLGGAVAGDFTAVLQARAFRSAGLGYPSGRTGSEHELWYQVAERWGIPTWPEPVVEVHHERGARLCSAAAQIREARSHALSQERTLAAFGHLMEGPFRLCRLRHLLGASTYWLVAGERRRSRDSSRTAARQFHSVRAAALYGLSYLPTACARVLLRGYRRLQGV